MSRTLRAASSVSALTLVSRILGFVRDMIMFRVLGSGWVTGTFVLAWMFPNMLRRLVGEGALSAAFIPSFASTLDREGKPAATRLLASISGALLLGLSVLTAVVLVLCFTLPPELVGDAPKDGGPSASETGALLLRLTAILFPYVILVCLIAVYNGALNSLSVFAWPAMLPAILNVFWIAGMVIGLQLLDNDTALITLTAVFLLGAGFVQLAVPALLLRRRGCLPAPRLPRRGDPALAVFVSMAPILIGSSMLQINTLVDQTFAYYLVGPGANGHVYLANRLMAFPHALTTVALATVVFPHFAVLASRAKHTELRQHAIGALQMSLFTTVPASVGLILIAPDFIQVFFASEKFTADDVHWASRTTSLLVAGLPFMGAAQLYTRALFALGDNKTPACIAAALVPLNLALNSLFLLVLDFGVPGLTLATSICAVVDATVLRRRFAKRCPGTPAPWSSLLRIVLATGVMAGLVCGLRSLFEANTDVEIAIFHLALPMGLGLMGYFATHWLIGGTEIRRLLGRLRS